MKKLTILCDMDETVVDFVPEFIKAVNEANGVDFQRHNMLKWNFEECEGLKHLPVENIYNCIKKPDFFRKLVPLPGGLETIKRFHDEGHEVVIVSTPSGAICAKEKIEWLEQHAPWLPHRNIILAHKKHLIKGDVLIDDNPHTLKTYAETWPDAIAIGIQNPYNEHLGSQIFYGYEDSATAWKQIDKYIRMYYNL